MFAEKFHNKVGFAVGTGRCGTKFISDILTLEKHVASCHERNNMNETFHRYCKWYDLPVDHEGFLSVKEKELLNDLSNHEFSFESSAHLSLSIKELYDRFNAKFILLVRNPENVVNSYLTKTWYETPYVQKDANLALGYQDQPSMHYFLGRIAPKGDYFYIWNKMSRIGKLAWYWKRLNEEIMSQFSLIPNDYWLIVKLEELSFERYLEITEFLGYKTSITKKKYDSIAMRRPNRANSVPNTSTWTQSQISEFEREVEPVAKILGYEHSIAKVISHSSIKKESTKKKMILRDNFKGSFLKNFFTKLGKQ